MHWHSKPKDVIQRFQTPNNDDVVAAKMYVDWKYGTADLHINLPAFKGRKQWKIDRIIVHELVHALVNEMRYEGIEHEERVVTSLTKAFFWTVNAARRGEIK